MQGNKAKDRSATQFVRSCKDNQILGCGVCELDRCQWNRVDPARKAILVASSNREVAMALAVDWHGGVLEKQLRHLISPWFDLRTCRAEPGAMPITRQSPRR